MRFANTMSRPPAAGCRRLRGYSGYAQKRQGSATGRCLLACVAIEIDRVSFEELVAASLDLIPAELGKRIDNLVVQVVDEPPHGENLLGLYEGVPLTSRGPASYSGFLPDRVTIYRGPILRMCDTREEVVVQVRITVIHEIGHFFGIDDDRLHELGYG